MKTVDCMGDICPVPIIKTKQAIKTMNSGDKIMVISDHSCSVESIKDLFKNKNYILNIEEVINGVWEITIKKD
ncbi:sulfurtransferase TusA family protein [Clostridiisalibacter paucivorans]|uniref:sulfurtransferase TusA family protein n=1 Tax=Clostridiisalibacter paucivorans TaxID=408753 RepID=UPI00047CBE7E|nr:sulfurtransferase TusA family protein [Clostridiisalibacter paucivorans]